MTYKSMQVELEALSLSRISGTAGAREGVAALVEKRQPHFRSE